MHLGHRFADALPELALPWQAEPAPDPQVLVLNEPLAAELGLTDLTGRFLVGLDVPEGAVPVAMAYAGHQFGGWSPRLGDGRALLLGDVAGRDLHLKGSGRTPFARGGDGLAAVGPMLREHLISEAMHALGIPTTRSLAVTATGRPVQRENGVLPGAVLARVASSHLRVGMFSFVAAAGDVDVLRRLADHAIELHCPGSSYLGLFEHVLSAQASLVAQWMLVGFVHGVMNTDNTTISGETIDYGPCAFLEAFDPAAVFSSIDTGGRYAFGNQPAALEWNLARLAEALLPLLSEDQDEAIRIATEALGTFRTRYAESWATGMRAKLGLPEGAPVEGLAQDLQRLMHESRADHTSTYRALSALLRGDPEPARGRFLDLAAFDAWVAAWRGFDPSPDAMDRVNPVYVPRNQLVDEALEAATGGDLAPFSRLLEVVRQPYDERPGLERYAAPAPEDFTSTFQTFCGT